MAGLYLMMPRGVRPGPFRTGLLFGGVGVIGLIAYLLGMHTHEGHEKFFFFLFSILAIASGAMMITQKKALYSALFFVMTILSVSGLLLLQQAEFLAFALVIIYAGAILVTYLFVLMLSRQDELAEHDVRSKTPFLAVVIIGVPLLSSFLWLPLTLYAGSHREPEVAASMTPLAQLRGTGSPAALGHELFDSHMLAIQAAGVLLLVAAVGGIALVRHLKVLK